MSAAFHCSISEFDRTTIREKLGCLSSAYAQSGFATQFTQQTSTWETQLEILGRAAALLRTKCPSSADWRILLEYAIPRRGKRPDAVLLAHEVVFVLEFKVGAAAFEAADEWQTLSYALDLRDFHAESFSRRIVPILVVSGVEHRTERLAEELASQGLAAPVLRVGSRDGEALACTLFEAYLAVHQPGAEPIDAERWMNSAYRPTPTIIEAAQTLFSGHSVAEISHAFATNLEATSQALVRAIEDAECHRRRTICFVTGIPGAGKTLAGLNAVHEPKMRRDGRAPAVFLSGNAPLIKVLREALTRNRAGDGESKRQASRTFSTFISSVHGFLQMYGVAKPTEPPHEHAIVWDEAQRAWNAAAVKKKHGIDASEPQLILDIMERSPDWSVIVALVGGGQEIHQGEGGLGEWGRALNLRGKTWRVMVSPEALQGGNSVAGHRLFEAPPREGLEIVEAPELHLNVNARSPRAQWLSVWLNALLSGTPNQLIAAAGGRHGEYPLVLTRELATAKRWLRERTESTQRCGLLASSGALRLRAHGIEVSSGFRRAFDYSEWFLGSSVDCRSSNQLEVAATEFECQGLELDWTTVCWGGDLAYGAEGRNWQPRRFHGNRWLAVRKAFDQQYVVNKYRVLLSRARRGMCIWVPNGDANDPTRSPKEMDAIAACLNSSGAPII